MKILIIVSLIPILLFPAFAQSNSQMLATEKGTLNVSLSYDEIKIGEQTRLHIEFLNPQTKKIQEHIDWTVSVEKDGEYIFGPIPLTHTSTGVVNNLNVEFPQEGAYNLQLGVEGILFQPIPQENVSFLVAVGEASAQPPEQIQNGGCLIATAAYGSELSPEVQKLRELRDLKVLTTKSGTSFMKAFNQIYYSFSPTVADLEREHPLIKESVKVIITPMITSLSLLNNVDIDSEEKLLLYGIPIVLFNIGMYAGIPIFGILKLYWLKK